MPRPSQSPRAAATDLTRLLAGFGAWQAAARVMPFGRVVAGALLGAQVTADLGARAMAHYRPGSRGRAAGA